jgi:hypothetical protein
MSIKKILLSLFLIIILVAVIVAGYLGLMPGISSVLGTNKPRDLGVTYTDADLQSARAKSKMIYDILPENTPIENSIQRTGINNINTEWTSAEMTALTNNRPWKYYPYKNVQVKFNEDGSGEISGTLIKEKVPGFAASIGIPSEVIETVMNYLPTNPVFYVKGRASLKNNKVDIFEPQVFEIGRLSMPVDMFLSFDGSLVETAYAEDLLSQLSGIKDKRAIIIAYINERLSSHIPGFYAKSASFGKDKLIFEGTVPAKESSVR